MRGELLAGVARGGGSTRDGRAGGLRRRVTARPQLLKSKEGVELERLRSEREPLEEEEAWEARDDGRRAAAPWSALFATTYQQGKKASAGHQLVHVEQKCQGGTEQIPNARETTKEVQNKPGVLITYAASSTPRYPNRYPALSTYCSQPQSSQTLAHPSGLPSPSSSSRSTPPRSRSSRPCPPTPPRRHSSPDSAVPLRQRTDPRRRRCWRA